jgi:hypothetical protein
MSPQAFTSIGLVLDIVGALLLWYFVAELSFVDKKAFLEGEGVLEIPNPSASDVSAYRRTIALSRLGIVLLIVGFAFQLLGTLLQ